MSQPAAPDISTLGELKASGYTYRGVKAEIRDNLIKKLQQGETLFDGVIGYEATVVPQITNALLGCQDIIFLGERGQAKSRMVRALTGLLDEWTPVLKDSEIPEDPLAPITQAGRTTIADHGDDTPITWLHRGERYGEKLATPDITIADIIG
ncbi:MAG: magnesium chelatase, partial [Pseudomonadota bacterium]